MGVVTLATCEGYNLNEQEELDTFERQLRAPFNGMRGKRGPFSLNMYKKYLLKREPFNGMRGKRGEEENLTQYETEGDELWGLREKRPRSWVRICGNARQKIIFIRYTNEKKEVCFNMKN